MQHCTLCEHSVFIHAQINRHERSLGQGADGRDTVQGYEKKEYAGDVRVHTISPGMVFTQLLLDQSTPELRKFPFGVLAAQPEEVCLVCARVPTMRMCGCALCVGVWVWVSSIHMRV